MDVSRGYSKLRHTNLSVQYFHNLNEIPPYEFSTRMSPSVQYTLHIIFIYIEGLPLLRGNWDQWREKMWEEIRMMKGQIMGKFVVICRRLPIEVQLQMWCYCTYARFPFTHPNEFNNMMNNCNSNIINQNKDKQLENYL